jgi:catalase
VVVDGIDFSNDRLLMGRTFAYSDSQRYRIGPNYLQLPINRPKCRVATNYGGGQMAVRVDNAEAGTSPHVNYEPSGDNVLKEAPRPAKQYEPIVQGRVIQRSIRRTDDHSQGGDFYRSLDQAHKDDLISNLIRFMGHARRDLQESMVEHFRKMDVELAALVGRGLNIDHVPAVQAAE